MIATGGIVKSQAHTVAADDARRTMAEGTIRIGPVVVRKRLAREVKMVELTSDSQQ